MLSNFRDSFIYVGRYKAGPFFPVHSKLVHKQTRTQHSWDNTDGKAEVLGEET
jgi:hypothetical protein